MTERATEDVQCVTSPTIRKRILKPCVPQSPLHRYGGYIAYDPQEDTETEQMRRLPFGLAGYIAYDPQEDTETVMDYSLSGRLLSYIAYDPQEDTETVGKCFTPYDAFLSYIAYDPQEDTETLCRLRNTLLHGVTSPTIRKRILKLSKKKDG